MRLPQPPLILGRPGPCPCRTRRTIRPGGSRPRPSLTARSYWSPGTSALSRNLPSLSVVASRLMIFAQRGSCKATPRQVLEVLPLDGSAPGAVRRLDDEAGHGWPSRRDAADECAAGPMRTVSGSLWPPGRPAPGQPLLGVDEHDDARSFGGQPVTVNESAAAPRASPNP